MNKLLKVTSLLALAVGSCGVYSAAQAVEQALATKHVLEGTYNNDGEYNGSVGHVSAETYTPIDTQLTVACPGSSGTCTIQADMWIENGGESSSDNYNVICLYVDGTPSSFCGAKTGETPSDGQYVQNSTSQAVTGLAHGNHTVQTYFYSVNGANVAYYNSNYRVYKP
jgi:hypothetical protein